MKWFRGLFLIKKNKKKKKSEAIVPNKVCSVAGNWRRFNFFYYVKQIVCTERNGTGSGCNGHRNIRIYGLLMALATTTATATCRPSSAYDKVWKHTISISFCEMRDGCGVIDSRYSAAPPNPHPKLHQLYQSTGNGWTVYIHALQTC